MSKSSIVVPENQLAGASFSIPVDPSKPLPDLAAALDGAMLSPETMAEMAVERAIPLKIGTGKPKRDAFFRVRNDEAWLQGFYFLNLDAESDRKAYLIAGGPGLAQTLEGMGGVVYKAVLYLAGTSSGQFTFWPVRMDSDNPWHVSARECAHLAKSEWIKVVSNKDEGRWVPYRAKHISREPKWPEGDSKADYLKAVATAYGDMAIMDLQHPVVAQLQGLDE